jgi:hypothetical protein
MVAPIRYLGIVHRLLWLAIGAVVLGVLLRRATPPTAPLGGTAAHAAWAPAPGATWQWQLDGEVDLTVDAQVYDLDLFDTAADQVQALHDAGRRAVCYLDAGTSESWRPDARAFPGGVLGRSDDGWSGERWLDIRQIDRIAPIMDARLDLCRDKGFDGVEADNVDGYQNDTGFPLTSQDQLAYNRWLAGEAHQRGLSIGLKNDPDQVADLVGNFDWALAEECFYGGWCAAETPFVQAGKGVFAAEYVEDGVDTDAFCAASAQLGLSGIIKHRDLDAWRQSCA